MRKLPNSKECKFAPVTVHLEDLERLHEIFSTLSESDCKISVILGKDTYVLDGIAELRELQTKGNLKANSFLLRVPDTALLQVGLAYPRIEIQDDADAKSVHAFQQVSELLRSHGSKTNCFLPPLAWWIIGVSYAVYCIVLFALNRLGAQKISTLVVEVIYFAWIVAFVAGSFGLFWKTQRMNASVNNIYVVPRDKVPNWWNQKNDTIRAVVISGVIVAIVSSMLTAALTWLLTARPGK